MTATDRNTFEELNRRLTVAGCLAMRLAHGHPAPDHQKALEREAAAAIRSVVQVARELFPDMNADGGPDGR